jgi:hypothetical protein
METITIKDGSYQGPRALAHQDFEGTLDTLFVDDKGMKVAHALNAKGGIVIGTYNKENELTEVFLPAAFLLETFAKPPEKKAPEKKKVDAPSDVKVEAEDETAKRSHHKKVDK